MNHQEIVLLLPWYLNETLEDERKREVEQHLDDCSECSEELAQLRILGKAEQELAASAPPLAEDALEQIFDRIDREGVVRTPPNPTPPANRPFPIPEWLRQTLLGWWPETPRFARALVVLQAIALVVIGSQLPFDAAFDTAGGSGDSPPAGGQSHVRIAIRFHETVTERRMRTLLRAEDATIVSGPSALGIYRIEVRGIDDPAKREQVVQRLRASSDLVEYVELEP